LVFHIKEFENRVLRRVCEPESSDLRNNKRMEKLHGKVYPGEELHNLYFTQNIMRIIKSSRIMAEACSMYGRDEKCVHILVGNHQGKRSLGRHKRRCEDNIKRYKK
jgi:hypothetical protein